MTPGRRILLLLAISIAGGYLAGRAFWSPQEPALPPAGPESGMVKQVPPFQLRDLAGKTRSIGEWTSKPLVINFWATWCAPCRKEMPLLEQWHMEQSVVAIVGVAIDREEPVRSFVAETGVTYPILVGQQDAMEVAESFGPGFVALPITVFAAPGGDIINVHVGELHPEDLARAAGVLGQVAEGTLSTEGARQQLEQANSGS